jgi:S-DNA-T family DNA segregation ATPase FtsK/SpoIIIE
MDGQRSWENVANGVIATVGPLVGAGLCSAWDIPAVVPAALAVTAVAGVAVRDWATGRPWSERVFRLAAGVAAGSWATWSSIGGPWQLSNLVVGGAAGLFGLAVAPAFVADEPTPLGQATQAVTPQVVEPTGRRATWKALIERIARVQPITITDDTDWPNGAGFTLHVVFAAGSGDSWTSVRDAAARLAAAARLPKGCAISVEEGDLQGTAVVRVPTVYALAGELPLPGDTSELSIWDDLPIGVNEDTTPALVNLRQASGLFVGRRGGGKTNLLKVLIGQLLRARDSVVWVADLNGGGLAVPFMLPYAKGEVQQPPIDWVAATPQEVVLMAQVAAAIAKDRKSRYAGLTAESGGDLLPVTRDLPQITIVVDESAEVDDDPEARSAMDALLKVQRIGRAEGVNVLFSALRATIDTIPVSVRKQSSLKLCGPVEDDTELEYVMPGARVRSADLVHPGTFFLRRGDQGAAVRQIKVWRTLPDRIRHLVVATDGRHPVVDPAGRGVGGKTYAGRMERLQPWLSALAGTVAGAAPAAPTVPLPSAGTHRAGAASAVVEVQPEAPASATERAEQRAKARENLRRFTSRMEVSQMPKDQLDDVFGALVADLRPQVAEQDGEGWRPELLLDVAREAGPEGIGPTDMQRKLGERGIKVSMKTVNKWVGKYAEDEKLRKLDGGKYTA